MSNILVTGSKGQLGLELVSLESNFQNYTFFFTDKNNLDITNFEAVSTFVSKNNIAIIINCAAYTNVDKAEEEPDLAAKINYLAVENLAKIAKKQHLKLVQISTDYVFDGLASAPYNESAKTNPQSVYGSTKLSGEKLVAEANPKHLILRTSWVFGIEGNNFVKTMLRIGSERDELSVVGDQTGSPTFAGDIAEALLGICQIYQSDGDIQWSTYHYCGAGKTTWHQFASEIIQRGYDAELIKALPQIHPILTENYPTPATRPLNSCLDCSRFESSFPTIGIKNWEDGLKELISSIRK